MKIPTIVQLAGLTALFAGVWMYSVPAALIVCGVSLTLIGIALERSE
jgi:hypothetical protein